jgi:hypothetical protein
MSGQQIDRSWSNGQITRLKLVRLQMYGRSKIDLLKAKLMNCIKIAAALSEATGPLDVKPPQCR